MIKITDYPKEERYKMAKDITDLKISPKGNYVETKMIDAVNSLATSIKNILPYEERARVCEYAIRRFKDLEEQDEE